MTHLPLDNVTFAGGSATPDRLWQVHPGRQQALGIFGKGASSRPPIRSPTQCHAADGAGQYRYAAATVRALEGSACRLLPGRRAFRIGALPSKG